MKRVYLAGSITGLTYDQSIRWREYAIKELAKDGITGVSPLRGKGYLRSELSIKASYEEHPLSCTRGITTRDRWDCIVSHVFLANFLNCKEASPGTCIELGWADLARVPIVIVMEKEGNPHDKALVNGVAGFRVETLDEGLDIVKALFNY